MRKFSVLILALLVLVIFPTWSVAGPFIPISPGQIAIIVDRSGAVVQVFDGNGVEYKSVEPHELLSPNGGTLFVGEIVLKWEEKSPWHWCVINGRWIRCP